MRHQQIGSSETGGTSIGKARPGKRRGDGGRWTCDPLKPDEDGDETLVTTPRRMLRLAIAAADAGSHFVREGLPHDPADWMISPRQLFGGSSAMDACQELQHFRRSVVLHSLSLGLDARREDIDPFLRDDPAGAVDQACSAQQVGFAERGGRDALLPGPRLLTCWIDASQAGSRLFAFCAVVADRPGDLVERVVGRFGADVASRARYEIGFDRNAPQAGAMIGDALAATLVMAARDPGSPLTRGLDVVVEQRLAA